VSSDVADECYDTSTFHAECESSNAQRQPPDGSQESRSSSSTVPEMLLK